MTYWSSGQSLISKLGILQPQGAVTKDAFELLQEENKKLLERVKELESASDVARRRNLMTEFIGLIGLAAAENSRVGVDEFHSAFLTWALTKGFQLSDDEVTPLVMFVLKQHIDELKKLGKEFVYRGNGNIMYYRGIAIPGGSISPSISPVGSPVGSTRQ